MKLSVYIPDDLAERLAIVKDRINVSEVCQAALSKAVAAAESARLGDERASIVERLKRARTSDEQRFDRGFADGRRWAVETAALTVLKTVVSSASADALVAVSLRLDPRDRSYVKGFRQGAREVWDSVRSEFGE